MTKPELLRIVALIKDRWPFRDHHAHDAYVARLWQATAAHDATDVEEAVHALMAQPYRGRARPTPDEIAERAEGRNAPVSTYVRYPEPSDEQRASASDQLRAWRRSRWPASQEPEPPPPDHQQRVIEAMRGYRERKAKR